MDLSVLRALIPLGVIARSFPPGIKEMYFSSTSLLRVPEITPLSTPERTPKRGETLSHLFMKSLLSLPLSRSTI